MKSHISKDGAGKTLYMQLNLYPIEGVSPSKTLYVACSDQDTPFRFTTSPAGLKLLGERLLELYKEFIIDRKPLAIEEAPPKKKDSPESVFSEW